MSTLSGIATKGEKGKSKFQSLDINNLYRASRGESLEPHQHKNTSSRRHGMQSLGKVPSARRAPANLPSLKSEYSGNDPAVSLVPSGGTGWGSKPGETGPPPTSTQAATSTTTTTPTPPSVASAPPATTTVTATTPTFTAPPTTTAAAPPLVPPTQTHGDKSWSSITSSGTEASPMFLAHQSPYFQQEFPSLSGDANATSGSGPNKGDPSHLPGPSLRPQTEGSWMQGGSRPQGQMAAGVGSQQGTAPVQGPLSLPQGLDVGGGRSNLGQSGGGVGPAGPIPGSMPAHHYRLMPQFMIRHNHPPGAFPPNYQHGPPRPRFPYPPDTRFMPPTRGPSNIEQEEITSRPIIKEEDLKVMDEIARDTGWAAHDEIDYNQTLSFSDEEGAQDDESKSKAFRQPLQAIEKRDADNSNKSSSKEFDSSDSVEKLNRENSRESVVSTQNENKEPPRAWQQPRPADFRQGVAPPMVSFPPQPVRVPNHQSGRQGEDEEVWRERRRIQNEEIAVAVERAKQRKEEEEKRYEESRQAAARKLQILEERMRFKTGGDKEEMSVSPPLIVQHGSNALLPDWEKDKEKSRSRTNSEDKDEKSSKEHLDNFRNVQPDNRSGFGRDRERDRDRELRPEREGMGQPFSRQFQSNLPPRFQKQAAERPSYSYRQGSGGSPQPPNSGQPPYDARWPLGQVNSHFQGSIGNVKSHRNHDSELSERDRDDNKEINRDRERNLSDGGFERDRFNRPPSRDSRERSHENSWKGTGAHEETSYNRIGCDTEHAHEYDNRQYDKCIESEDSNKEKDKEFTFYDEGKDIDKSSNENFKSNHSLQDDPFDERDKVRDNKVETERREAHQKSESRDRPERPQRPDSRDSRASRDSRNSKDSIKEEKLVEESILCESSLSWADSTYDLEPKEDKLKKDMREERRDLHIMQSYHQRHIPGPITKEKLEASELKCESTKNINLVPLVRTDKKPELKKPENQWELAGKSADAWQRVVASPAPATASSSDSWADLSSSSTAKALPHPIDSGKGEPIESQQVKVNSNEEANKTEKKISNQSHENTEINHRQDPLREKNVGRGGNRGLRHDSRGSRQGWGGNNYYRGPPPMWNRGSLGGKRAPQRKPNMGQNWHHSESESADEVSVSTESGKEDKRQDQDRKHFPRSPKQGMKKSDKEDRVRDSNRKVEGGDKDNYSFGNDNRRFDKRGMYDSNFEPRGEPSRRGRGGPFRSKGSAANVGRRMGMDGYGPPTTKRPFTSETSTNVHEEKKIEGSVPNQSVNKPLSELSHDDKMKLNQQQLSAGIIAGGASRMNNFKSQGLNMPPRLRRKSEGERRDRKPRDASGRGPRGSIKSGSGSGGEVGDENWETTSETSEQEEREHRQDDRQNDSSRRSHGQNMISNRGHPRRHSQANREKRNGGSYDRDRDHNSRRQAGNSGPQSLVNGNMRLQGKNGGPGKDQSENKSTEQSGDKKQPRPENKEKRNNLDRIDLCNTASVVVIDDQPEGSVEEDQTVFAPDNNNGFQEVRSKKNVKEANRQQKEEPQKGAKDRAKQSKPPSSQSPGPPGAQLLASAPNKGAYDRQRGAKLPPRLAKLKESCRLQKMAQQQHETSELNKINQGGVSGFPIKDLTSPPPPPPVNAWDKPITGALRTSTPPAMSNAVVPIAALADPCNVEVNEHVHSTTSSQRSSPNDDKTVSKLPREPIEKAVLDGTSPPVQTIIFENTNYKSAPVDVAMKSKYTNQMSKSQRPEKPRDRKLEEETVSMGFKSPGPDMKLQDNKTDPIQMPISFTKNEDNADMKLDFRFDSDLSQLTDDKTSKSMTAIQMTRSIQIAAQSSTADLQFKLASVKKVWENPPAVLEHGGEESSVVSTATSFTPTFGNSVEDSGAYGKASVPVVDPSGTDDGTSLTPDSVYNSSQQLQSSSNSYNGSSVQNMIKPDPSSNVCKVKPQPQTMHPHTGPLSPPSGAFNSSPAPPSQHINYQIRDTKLEPKAWIQFRESDSQKTGYNQSLVYTYLSNCDESWHKVQPPGADPQQFQQCRPNMTPPAQYSGIPAIPSPPTAFPPQAELYQTFQINNPQVMGSQGRSQFSQFGSPYLSQGLGQNSVSGFSQQSMYLHQTAAPPPPPNATPDMFQTPLNQYRIQPPTYGTSQQLSSNPNTMLISSSTNSLMSATVKPSPQPIGAIGSKGASYQAPSQPPSQVYIYPDPQLLNQTTFLQNSQLVQRPASNVVPTLPPSSASYYSTSTGGGATGFYQPGSSSLQAAAQGMHQPTFGMQTFNTQSPAATPAGMGSFGSTMAQQYRSTAPSYLKSAPDHQDVLSVFSSPASQINSPKSHPGAGGGGSGGKPGGASAASQQQSSPNQSHYKFTAYQQNVSPTTQLMIQQQQQQQQQQRSSVSVRVAPRYPAPIQRPITFQPAGRHRPPTATPRYKLPPPSSPATTAAATTANHFYVTQNNSPKLDSPEIDAKVEEVSTECENSTSGSANNSTDIAADDSKSTND